VEEVARLVGRSAYTVRRWIAEHRINASRIADTGPRGRLLIPREEVGKLISEGKGNLVAFQLDNQNR
jgi:excisionase family DNA binding protein